MVSTQELIVVVSTDTVDLVSFRYFFSTSAIWVATILATAREVDIFPVACRVHCGATTLDGALRDDLGWRPTRHGRSLIIAPHHRVGDVFVDGRSWCCLYVRNVADLVVALVLVAQRCGTPIDAFAVLQKQDMTTQ
jgi:hypothetical protein